jgi:hypothetical protein
VGAIVGREDYKVSGRSNCISNWKCEEESVNETWKADKE